MSDTPRTDSKESQSEKCEPKMHAHYGWKFARELERELKQAETERSAMLMLQAKASDKVIELMAENEGLRKTLAASDRALAAQVGQCVKYVERMDAAETRAADAEKDAIERCAKVCEDWAAMNYPSHLGYTDKHRRDCTHLAAAIRALSKPKA